MFSFFKKEKINIWNVLAQELNGVFIPAKYDECAKTEIVYKDWKIILDNYINYIDVGNSSREKWYTRVIAKYEATDDFRFEIYKKGFIRSIEKFFGAQDLEIGIPDFDKKFIIKSNNGFKIKKLLQNNEIRNILKSLKDVNIETSNRKGIWGQELSKNELELSYFTHKEIKDLNELKTLLKLFQLILDDLHDSKLIK